VLRCTCCLLACVRLMRQSGGPARGARSSRAVAAAAAAGGWTMAAVPCARRVGFVASAASAHYYPAAAAVVVSTHSRHAQPSLHRLVMPGRGPAPLVGARGECCVELSCVQHAAGPPDTLSPCSSCVWLTVLLLLLPAL
jgi:hypothetical protein